MKHIVSVGMFLTGMLVFPGRGDAASFAPEVWFGDTPAFRSDKVGLRWNLMVLHLAVRSADWAQTTQIARNPDRYYEMNPLLGKHPSTGRVNTHFILGMTTEVLVTAFWPEEHETALLVLQALALALSAGLVVHNSNIGLSGDPVEDISSMGMRDNRMDSMGSPRFMLTLRW